MLAGNQVLPEDLAAPQQMPARPRRGGGGRWRIWPLRILAWAILLVIGYRGVAAIIAGPAPPGDPAGRVTTRQASAGFPVTLAEAYALQFGQAYLNFSPGTAAQRAAALQQFLPAGADSQLGWDGAGTQTLQAEQVASVSVRDSRDAVITLLARVNGRLIELGVPVYSAGNGLVISGEPALLPPPPRAVPPPQPPPAPDQAVQSALSRLLPAFFQAYAAGDSVTLGRFLAAGARVTGLGGAVALSAVSAITVPAGGVIRHITATVTWQLPGSRGGGVGAAAAQLQMTYALTIVRQSGSWYVLSIGAAPVQAGPP
jgi:hypothetical protein